MNLEAEDNYETIIVLLKGSTSTNLKAEDIYETENNICFIDSNDNNLY